MNIKDDIINKINYNMNNYRKLPYPRNEIYQNLSISAQEDDYIELQYKDNKYRICLYSIDFDIDKVEYKKCSGKFIFLKNNFKFDNKLEIIVSGIMNSRISSYDESDFDICGFLLEFELFLYDDYYNQYDIVDVIKNICDYKYLISNRLNYMDYYFYTTNFKNKKKMIHEYFDKKTYLDRYINCYKKYCNVYKYDIDVSETVVKNSYMKKYSFLNNYQSELQLGLVYNYQLKNEYDKYVFRGETIFSICRVLNKINNNILREAYIRACYTEGNFYPIPYLRGKSLNQYKGSLYEDDIKDSMATYLEEVRFNNLFLNGKYADYQEYYELFDCNFSKFIKLNHLEPFLDKNSNIVATYIIANKNIDVYLTKSIEIIILRTKILSAF